MASNDLPRTNPFAAALEAHQDRRERLLDRFLGPAKTEDTQQGAAGTAGQQERAQGRSGGTP